MGQRKKPRRQRRVPGGSPARINIRTTEATRAELDSRAAAAGVSLPRYLVECGLGDGLAGTWSLRQRRWVAERLDVIDTRLDRIGVNLNQLTAAAHATGHVPTGLAGALAYHTATQQLLRQVLAALDTTDPTRGPAS
jgi:hypothetical protein